MLATDWHNKTTIHASKGQQNGYSKRKSEWLTFLIYNEQQNLG